ncbi:hypothetical protein RRG08_025746 [Elysia crispata]|uniref:Uncharacterized protein n=1 Tax=Elysia crispata TaxID=231223 RepID=A0AAE1DZN1_9GAST|nr:hypothetical protein RRG08_025746 [Elysia crispata]
MQKTQICYTDPKVARCRRTNLKPRPDFVPHCKAYPASRRGTDVKEKASSFKRPGSCQCFSGCFASSCVFDSAYRHIHISAVGGIS